MAAMRLNIPTIFVSGGPMEAGKTKLSDQLIRLDLVDAMIESADPNVSDERIDAIERQCLPDLWFLFRYVHRKLNELFN